MNKIFHSDLIKSVAKLFVFGSIAPATTAQLHIIGGMGKSYIK